MSGKRSSARLAAHASSGPKSTPDHSSRAPRNKRQGGSAAPPKSKKSKRENGEDQMTIEQSMGKEEEDQRGSKDVTQPEYEIDQAKPDQPEKTDEQSEADEAGANKATDADFKSNGNAQHVDSKHAASKQQKDAVEESSQRQKAVPSSILEKGIIYFFFRARVNMNDPSSPNDIARSYMVLRPMPHGSKLGEGPIGDGGKNRLLALPKKVLPKSPRDRFMTFVEKGNASMDDIKKTFAASDYATATRGTSHTPAATPFGEGVYALTKTGRDSHLAYIVTIPSEVNEVQEDVGLRQRGSYYVSAKNPTQPAPANTSLPQGPDYPQEILDEFSGRRWMPLEPKLLDYDNTQFLLIGHGDNPLDKATSAQPDDQKEGKEEPREELEKLEHEDEMRINHLAGDDSVFVDLGLSSKEYPTLQTTW